MPSRIGLITGCGQGIGLSIIKKTLLHNHDDIVIGISRNENLKIKQLKNKYKDRFLFEQCDIGNVQKLNSFLNKLQNKYGPFNYAVLNAGIRSRSSMEESNLELYRSILEINTIANINITKQIIKNCLTKDVRCNILFISSIVGARGFNELSTYATSKSALEGFMKSIAVEHAKEKIQLNCLAPGFVESSYADNFKLNKKDLYEWTLSQIPMGRWGKCEEIAELALFLVSEKNSYMTGSVIYSDGGWTA